jgi:predicted DNA-binding protein
MSHGVTTSIRIPAKVREELDEAAHSLHRGRNWIILRALEDYLSKLGLDQKRLIKEARRQSLLANRSDQKKKVMKENQAWEDDADTTGWT